ncbi:MAG: hypothetical protein JWM11_5245 [Planctomycetaceae bacterium]|nr:hypothetical protein [Planctomycetaceae bacterium]
MGWRDAELGIIDFSLVPILRRGIPLSKALFLHKTAEVQIFAKQTFEQVRSIPGMATSGTPTRVSVPRR